MRSEGRVWKFGDHVDTDLIIPARYLSVSDEAEMARHCFADHRPEFADQAAAGDIIVAGMNFGCGSSREHAPLAIKASGVGVVIARSFARIFYRNAFNIGLPVLESNEAAGLFSDGDRLSVNIVSGEIAGVDGVARCRAMPIPPFMMSLLESGGLINHIRAKNRAAKSRPV